MIWSSITKKFNKNGVLALLAPAVLVLLFILGFFMTPTPEKYVVNILDSSYYIGYMAIGVTFVIITAGIDLALGTNMMCAALLGGWAYTVLEWPMAFALLLVIGTAVILGFFNGILIAYLKLPPFIATLGMQMIGMGFGAIVTNVQTMRYPTFGTPEGAFKNIFYKTVSGFPIGILWLIVFFAIAWVLLNKTKFGRYTYAIGSNSEAARLSGIKTRPWLTAVYTFCGLCSGLAGVMYAAVYTSIIPQTGNGQELLGIAGAVIGGTSMSGGMGTVVGTMIGVFIMSVLQQDLYVWGFQPQWQKLFTGIVVILAVLLDQYRIKQGNKVKK